MFHVKQSMNPQEFQQQTGLDDTALARLRTYVDLLTKWQARINLVSRASLQDVWRRHVYDSAQLGPLLPEGAETLADLGSGAGFPGLVLAAITPLSTHLIESDGRKAAFLREAARAMELEVTVHAVRIEDLEAFEADVVTARALAPLADLLGYAEPFLRGGGTGLFLKGKSADEELTVAAKQWTISAQPIPSSSDPTGTILKLEGPLRRHV